MKVYELILKRRTIRRFQQKPIAPEILKKIINAARVAPSGANLQPCEYIIVDNSQLVDQVFATLKWAAYIAPAGDPPLGERPVAYIIVLVNLSIKRKGGEVDAAAAIENMILTALDENIGSCWLHSVNRDKVRSIFKIPLNYAIDSVLALGYPNESPIMEEMTDSIRYWKDKENILHVPKRKLADIMHDNKF